MHGVERLHAPRRGGVEGHRIVADRIEAGPGTRDYGVLSISLQLHADVRRIRAMCLTDSTPWFTALANDVGFDVVFARQVAAWGRPGDVAFAAETRFPAQPAVEVLHEPIGRGAFGSSGKFVTSRTTGGCCPRGRHVNAMTQGQS